MRALQLPFFFFIAVTFLLLSSSVVPDHNLGFCADRQTDNSNIHMAALGGLHDSNPDLESLARFAVDHHNSKEVYMHIYHFLLYFYIALIECSATLLP